MKKLAKIFKTLLVILLTTCHLCANAQQYEITGKVTDEKSEPFPGANIIIDSTTIGTTTDQNGEFKLLSPFKNIWLRVSLIEYPTILKLITLTHNHTTNIQVTLTIKVPWEECKVVYSNGNDYLGLTSKGVFHLFTNPEGHCLGDYVIRNDTLSFVHNGHLCRRVGDDCVDDEGYSIFWRYMKFKVDNDTCIHSTMSKGKLYKIPKPSWDSSIKVLTENEPN
jgi:hypothetical protein